MKHFFISYNSANRTWAEWIAWQLEEKGYEVVIQAWDFRPGSNFVLEMQRAAEEAERTIAVLSPSYLNALYTQPEWAAAFVQDPKGKKGTLLPVRVRECELKGLLASIIYIDLVELDETAAKDKLLAGIKCERDKPTTPPCFPGGTQRSVAQKPDFPGILKEVSQMVNGIEHAKQAGLVAIYESAQKTRDFTLKEATESYWLMGVSGQYVRGAETFLKYLPGDRRRLCQYRFLLLSPDSCYLEQHASRENLLSLDVITGEIHGTIETLKDFRRRFKLDIEIRLYRELPTFRILLIDEKRCYVSFYGTSLMGIDAPQMVFEKTAEGASFYFPFRSLYEQYWEKAIPLEEWEQSRDRKE